jgi:hypothetical protein
MFTHIRAAGLTLQGVLQRTFSTNPAQMVDRSPGAKAIPSLATPDMETASDIGLSKWLYRVRRYNQTLNQPPRRIAPNLIRRQPLPVRALSNDADHYQYHQRSRSGSGTVDHLPRVADLS